MEGGYRIRDQYATYFLTMTIVGWIDLFTRKECKEIIVQSLKYCQHHKGLILYAFVIMESHLHLIASAQQGSKGLSSIIRDFKTFTSGELINWIQDNRRESRRDWWKLFLSIMQNSARIINSIRSGSNITDQKFARSLISQQKLDYIHHNPVRAGIVDDPVHYVYSSARNYANRRDYILDLQVLEFGSDIGRIGR